jgi:membrane-bound inhibitor of C-type lysozyme
MINDNFALTGALTISLNNEIVQRTKNLVVDDGKEWVARRMSGADSNMTHMAIGTNTTAAAAGDTSLGTELERNALTVSGGTVGTGADANTIVYACTYGAGDGTGAITEAGIFDTLGSKVDDIAVTAGGSGYTGTPTAAIGTQHAASTAYTLSQQVANGANLYTVTSAGTSHASTAPTHITGAVTHGTVEFTYAGAAATATVTKDGSNVVISLTVTASGSGYTSTPAIVISGAGSSATATATMKEGGDMLARTKFAVVNKGVLDSMTITWTITVS